MDTKNRLDVVREKLRGDREAMAKRDTGPRVDTKNAALWREHLGADAPLPWFMQDPPGFGHQVGPSEFSLTADVTALDDGADFDALAVGVSVCDCNYASALFVECPFCLADRNMPEHLSGFGKHPLFKCPLAIGSGGAHVGMLGADPLVAEYGGLLVDNMRAVAWLVKEGATPEARLAALRLHYTVTLPLDYAAHAQASLPQSVRESHASPWRATYKARGRVHDTAVLFLPRVGEPGSLAVSTTVGTHTDHKSDQEVMEPFTLAGMEFFSPFEARVRVPDAAAALLVERDVAAHLAPVHHRDLIGHTRYNTLPTGLFRAARRTYDEHKLLGAILNARADESRPQEVLN